MFKSKLLFSILLIAVIVSSLYGATSYYKYEVFEAAMAFEREKAQLVDKRIQVGDLDIAYLEGPKQAGQQSVLLIHGFGAIKENWLRFASELTSQYHVVAIDLPGHGESTKNPELSYRLELQVERVHQFAKSIGLDKFNIAGNSMGGAISSLYAAKYPKDVLTVTLFDPAGIHDVESELMVRLKEGDNPLIVSDQKSFDRLLAFAMEKPPFIPWPITEVAAEQASRKQKVNAKIFTDLTSGDQAFFKSEIAKIQAPTLIIWGDQDRVIHVDNADLFYSLITGSKKIILPGIGHVPMIEVPKQSADLFVEFVTNPA